MVKQKVHLGCEYVEGELIETIRFIGNIGFVVFEIACVFAVEWPTEYAHEFNFRSRRNTDDIEHSEVNPTLNYGDSLVVLW